MPIIFTYPTEKENMATAKKTAKSAPAKKATTPVKAAPATVKPVKTAFTKPSLAVHLAEQSGVELKTVKAVIAALEATVLGAVSKKGLGAFTLPGLLKLDVQKVPAKKKRRGIDPFTKVEREFAAKPASVRIKVRALKKLKDAAL